jgi:hypothetical protein
MRESIMNNNQFKSIFEEYNNELQEIDLMKALSDPFCVENREASAKNNDAWMFTNKNENKGCKIEASTKKHSTNLPAADGEEFDINFGDKFDFDLELNLANRQSKTYDGQVDKLELNQSGDNLFSHPNGENWPHMDLNLDNASEVCNDSVNESIAVSEQIPSEKIVTGHECAVVPNKISTEIDGTVSDTITVKPT